MINQCFDEFLFQLSKGVTIEKLERGIKWQGFEQVKEWKSRFGYQFHIFSNDHLIDKKPHFHLIKQTENVFCRFFFDGTLHDCKGKVNFNRTTKKELDYFLSKPYHQKLLIEMWNNKNLNHSFIN